MGTHKYDIGPRVLCTARHPNLGHACQKQDGHTGQHWLMIPDGSSVIVQWPAVTNTTCGDV